MAAVAKQSTLHFPREGNLAREVEWDVREREFSHAGEAPSFYRDAKAPGFYRKSPSAAAAPAPTVQAVPVAQTIVKPAALHVSPLTVIAFLCAVVLAGWLIYSYMEIATLSRETVKLKSELTVLETENVNLLSKYERMFDRTTVKEAALAAGMSKPSPSQTFYYDLSEGDQATVYDEQEPSLLEKGLKSVAASARNAVEFFR